MAVQTIVVLHLFFRLGKIHAILSFFLLQLSFLVIFIAVIYFLQITLIIIYIVVFFGYFWGGFDVGYFKELWFKRYADLANWVDLVEVLGEWSAINSQ